MRKVYINILLVLGVLDMNNINELKEQLINIKSNSWSIPENINRFEFALELLDNIGSTDPELRDKLILELLCYMITENILEDKELKAILDLILSEKHLFNDIGKIEDDSVFNRAFCILIIGCILYRHNQNESKLFEESEIKRIYKNVIKYLKAEKDVRGYIMTKGWAHSAAHTADALAEIANCKEITELDLMGILEGVKEKICINYYVYVNNEEERLVTTVINVLERKIIDDKKVITWIKSFENMDKTGVYPEDHNLISNHKAFLSALYFRLKRRVNNEKLLHAIEEVINNTTPVYFK